MGAERSECLAREAGSASPFSEQFPENSLINSMSKGWTRHVQEVDVACSGSGRTLSTPWTWFRQA